MKPGRIRGVPGAGKTREVIGLALDAARKYGIERVGVLTFTNAGADEVKSRMMSHGFDSQQASNFTTIHAMCFRLLHMTKDRVAEANIKEFNAAFPHFALTGGIAKDDEVGGGQKANDAILSKININRARLVPVSEWMPDLVSLWESWHEWMIESDYCDFTGMLERCFRLDKAPDLDVLFIDEAQDLSALQLKLTWMWGEETISTIWVGDSDQAIFKWSGASPDVFDSLEVEWSKVLDQSHRVPRAPHVFCMDILGRIQDREQINFKPTDSEGTFYYEDVPDLSLPGSHMILCRANYQVHRWIEFLTEQKILWHNLLRREDLTWNPSRTKVFKAVRAYNRLMAGEFLGLKEIKLMADIAISKGNLDRGAKTIIKGIEDIEAPVDLFEIGEYGFKAEFLDERKPVHEKFKMTGRAGALLISAPDMADQTPRVTVGTMHSVKGGQARHVHVDMDAPYQTRKSVALSTEAMDDELRVLYVGCTRTQETLGILNKGKGIL